MSSQELRAALGRFATGVAVVTTETARGPVGMTINSFTSVSLTPPLVLFCVDTASSLHDSFVRASAFAVNVLSSDQLDHSRRFATRGSDRRVALHPRSGTAPVPLLDGTVAQLVCHTHRVTTAGDHSIIIGMVERVHSTALEEVEPLIFYGGSYRRLATRAEPSTVDAAARHDATVGRDRP